MPKLLLKVLAVFLNIGEGYKVWGPDLSVRPYLILGK